MIFKHCPNCASMHIEFANNVRFFCFDCGFTYFHNIAAAVAVIFRNEDKILFVVRNIDPDKGKLDLPGGFIDPNETAEEAVVREVREELGLNLQLTDLEYVTTFPNNYLYKNVPYRTMDIFYQYWVKEPLEMALAKDEISSYQWIAIDQIELEKIGFVSVRNVISSFFK